MRQPRTCCYRFVLLFWLGLSLAGPGVAQAQPAVPTFPVPSTVLRTANLRASPSTTAARIGSAPAGSTLTFAGCNAACDWYETAEGAWIAAFLVEVQAGRAALLPTPTPIAIVQGTPATVTKIVDGDTIEVSIDGSSHRLRYILVNTPETGQPYAAEATAANSALVAGKTVYLVQDVSETDRYDRLLRYVYLADGTFVNAELVRQGFAQVATYPPDVSQEAVIRAAEAEARAAGRGLWATGAASFGPAGAATTGAANLRAGPGTDYPVVRTAPAGTALALTGRDASGEWLQTAEGLWVFAALVEGAPTSLGVVGVVVAVDAPQRSGGGVTVPLVVATPVATAVPVAVNAAPSGNASVQVVVVVNSSTNEILEIRNTGGAPLDIGRWWLDGSKGEDSCVIPAGTVLAPGAGYQVATGDSEPQGAGVKCGDKPIWNNGGEVVYLHGVDGSVVIEVEAGRR